MDIMIIINKMIQLFIMIIVGFIIGKTKLFENQFNNQLTQLVLNITMPCLIMSSVMSSINNIQLALKDILISTLFLVVILPIVAYICIKILPFHQHQELYLFMMMYPNVGFMGFPLMQAIFGEKAILSTAIINLGFNLSLFTLGEYVMSYSKNKHSNFSMKSLLTPGVISSIGAIIIYIMHIKFPSLFVQPITLIGNMTTPLAMMIIGMTLSQYHVQTIINDYKVYFFTLFIDLLLPMIFYPAFNIFINNQMIKGISLIILAMPVANGAVLFAKKYNQDELLATKTVFISTLLSILTIPFIVYICL